MPACKTKMADVNKTLSDSSTEGSLPPTLRESSATGHEMASGGINPATSIGEAVSLINDGFTDEMAMGGLEAGFFRYLLNPMMDEMEKSVNQSNEILDDLIRNMKEERDTQRKKELSSHIPRILHGSGVEMGDIMKHIENFITYENYELEHGVEQDKANLRLASVRDLDGVARMSVLGHSVAAYVSILENQHLKHIANKIVTDVTIWLCGLFRFPNASAHMHEEDREGLVRIAHLALHRKYPKYATDGYEVLFPRPPVIYISSAAKHNIAQHVCHQLGLPLSCVCSVPAPLGKIDVSALNKLIEDDVGSGKVPTMLVAFAGTPLLGRVDDIGKLSELCRQHDMWLHLEGSSLTQLADSTLPSYLTSATQANSVTLNLSAWLSLPAVPFVTLFHSPDVMLTRAASLSTFNVRYRLNCVSLWMCMLNLGLDNISARLLFHTQVASILHSKLSNIQTSNDLILLDIEGPSVILRYQRRADQSTADEKHSTHLSNGTAGADEAAHLESRTREKSSDGMKATERDQYFDTLNIWLVETLRREIPDMHVAAVELDKIGLCIRYAPLETNYMVTSCSQFEVNMETLERFVECVDHNIEILDATVSMKQNFEEIVNAQDNMRVAYLPSWAGLGAVQYIPEKWMKDVDNLSDEARDEINIINHQMVNQLKSTDTAFSLGQTDVGLYCVRFGLVTEDTDLEELIAIVYNAGKEVEESSKFIETMSDVVRQGIEQAAIDLVKENQEKLMQEGVLRQVPLVSSLINWWSPPPKDSMKGRTFNLNSGKIASTEDTYKYHMQIQQGPTDHTPVMPKPKDGPLKANLKPARSKNLDATEAAAADVSAVANGQVLSTAEEQQKSADVPVNVPANVPVNVLTNIPSNVPANVSANVPANVPVVEVISGSAAPPVGNSSS